MKTESSAGASRFPHRVLILFAHPALEKSRVNRRLIEPVRELAGVTFHDLYEAYPDFDIDVEREQRLVEAHDILVLHHPMFWYSTPSLLKEWQDLVLEHGWAYGSTGRALVGKVLLQVVTTGGSESAYQERGRNRFTVRQLLAPIEQTSTLCGMDYLPPFVAHGTHQMDRATLRRHGADYLKLVEALRDGRLDFSAARQVGRLNASLDTLISDREAHHA